MQSEEVEEEAVAEDPLRHLLSDTDSEPEEIIKQMHVNDEGSEPQFVVVDVQGCQCMGW